MRGHSAPSLILGLVLGAVGAACSASDTADEGVRVEAVMTDDSVRLSPAKAPAGTVTFRVVNQGTVTHELEVFRTDLAPDSLPVEGSTASPGLAPLDEVENVEPGLAMDLAVTLEPGNYVLICNLPAHYQQGMRANFTAR